MTGVEAERSALRELLIDGIGGPPEALAEALFERTFAADRQLPGDDLLPPAGLFDPAAADTSAHDDTAIWDEDPDHDDAIDDGSGWVASDAPLDTADGVFDSDPTDGGDLWS